MAKELLARLASRRCRALSVWPHTHRTSRSSQAGITLVETMVVLSIMHWGRPQDAGVESVAVLSLFVTRVWPFSWLVIAGCGIHSIFRSHKIFGPVTNFRNAVREIAAGNFTRRIQLRDGDLMQDLAEDMNSLVSGLDRRLDSAQESCQELEQRAASLRAALPSDSSTAQQLAQFDSILAGLRKDLAFTTTRGHEADTAGGEENAAEPERVDNAAAGQRKHARSEAA